MEVPPIFDEFFNETSVWFLLFMLVSFLLGVITASWMYQRAIRVQRKQIIKLKEEIIQIRDTEDNTASLPEKQKPPLT